MALLRLPGAMPYQLKIARMMEVVDALELNKCLDTSEFTTHSPHLSYTVCLTFTIISDTSSRLKRPLNPDRSMHESYCLMALAELAVLIV